MCACIHTTLKVSEVHIGLPSRRWRKLGSNGSFQSQTLTVMKALLQQTSENQGSYKVVPLSLQ